MSALPLVTPINISQYQRFNTNQQVSHDRHHSNRFNSSPAIGESPLPLIEEERPFHPPDHMYPSPFSTLTRQCVYLPQVDHEKPSSAPADSASFPVPGPYGYVTPPQQYTVLDGTPLRPVPAAWPGIRPQRHRSQSWAASTDSWATAPPPATISSPSHTFSSPEYSSPLHRPFSMLGGIDGYNAAAYATYPYPSQPEWDIPRAAPRRSTEPEKGGKKHVCLVCDKKFNRPSSLGTHMAVHTGAKPFICPRPDCGRRFSISSNLRRHEKVHAPRGVVSSPEASIMPPDNLYQYSQTLASSPYAHHLPLEWHQPAPLSSGLGHYSINRTSTRHGDHPQPTTPETPPVLSLAVDEEMDGPGPTTHAAHVE